MEHYINNTWVSGQGKAMISYNPATNDILWEGHAAVETQVNEAVSAAKKALPSWANLSFAQRENFLQKFKMTVQAQKKDLVVTLSQENGKPLWESDMEVSALINKVDISISAYHERSGEKISGTANNRTALRHKPHGVVGVFGPFNFPVSVPAGHIIPALLAGNTVVFKPSELTPLIASKIIQCWEAAGLPKGVINLIQGAGETGKLLSMHPNLNGIFFTGSFKTGDSLIQACVSFPYKILALEMGGNNPLIIHDIDDNISAAVYHTIQSAYVTSGQRCTCARRLIVTKNNKNEAFVEALKIAASQLKIGPFSDVPEPFMGPVVSREAALKITAAYQNLLKMHAKELLPLRNAGKEATFLSPALLDVTEIKNRPDEEIFGPVLQLIWVKDFEAAIQEANNTAYGLSASIFCQSETLYKRFLQEIKAGVVNWNRATSGASSHLPFGGIGKSGNFRPSAYYAADYCAYPVASLEESSLTLPTQLTPGVKLP